MNKNDKFWRNLGNGDILVLIETWIKEKKRKKVKLPRGYVWKLQLAKRR